MKKILALLSLLLPLFAQNYTQMLQKIDNSLLFQQAQKLTIASKKIAEAAQGKNLPSLDASLQAIHLQETPTMYLHMPQMPVTGLPMGKKEQWQGELRLTYPLFSGFAITAAIHKAKLEYQKAKLKKDDLKRNLYMQITMLYSSIFALKQKLQALQKAHEAIELAYKKAKGFHDKGLLAPSELYNLEAKKYGIAADITQTKGQITALYNDISHILNTKISTIDGLVSFPEPQKAHILQTAMQQREDLKALQKSLRINEEDIILAKSSYYPKIALIAALKKHGDSIALNGDGFTNADQSYAGAVFQWNLFSGLSDTRTVEAAKIKKAATALQIAEYKKKIATNINNAFVKLAVLQQKLKSAQAQVKAQKEYYKLTQGRFDNQLTSADELSRSIADLAAAKAKKAAIKAEIFNQKAYIYLLSGLKNFEKVALQR
ncbi:outer membrane protein [Nitratiruptor sp. YY08-26]|uniref:TolC family protein n=1 Tax=unclassified Nitratiruptor TaxID=2624044 RepID=UPI001915970A|nr:MULTISPECIES: TolC family protein [unclassified Nitratiruptor]BCD61662.1 outer membrane protein [Nitratiruptor sp. YY08-13]BCD65597.1 outer membrane protein [Nitratiruptor sp. YY08-26]